MENQEQYFDQYLFNELSPVERSRFEERLANDDLFNESFTEHKLLASGIAFSGASELKSIIQDAEKQYEKSSEQKETSLKSFKQWIPAAAAATLLLCICSYFFLNSSNSLRSDEIYQNYYSALEMDYTQRGNAEQSLLKDLNTAYNKQAYQESAVILNELIAKDDKLDYKLYLAITFIEQNKIMDAQKLLSEIASSNTIIANQAKWYLALTNIKMDNKEEATKYLKELSLDENSDHFEDAKTILSHLK